MSDPSWWTIWGQSTAAAGGLLFGAAGLGLGIYNACISHRKHGWEKQDRERQEQYEEWCAEKAEALRTLKKAGIFILEVEEDRVHWLQRAEGEGRLKSAKRGDGKWFARLP